MYLSNSEYLAQMNKDYLHHLTQSDLDSQTDPNQVHSDLPSI